MQSPILVTLIPGPSGVLNPINTSAKSGFTISTTDSLSNLIDSGTTATLTVTDPGDIPNISLFQVGGASAVKTVSEPAVMGILFLSPFPMEAGC